MNEYPLSQTFSSGNIFAIRFTPEIRKINGLLQNPPIVFVVTYDQEFDRVVGDKISWRAAEALAPEDMEDIKNQLAAAREIEKLV